MSICSGWIYLKDASLRIAFWLSHIRIPNSHLSASQRKDCLSQSNYPWYNKTKPFFEGDNLDITSNCIHYWNLDLLIFFFHQAPSLWSVISELHQKVNYMCLERATAAGLRAGDGIYAVASTWSSPQTSCLLEAPWLLLHPVVCYFACYFASTCEDSNHL